MTFQPASIHFDLPDWLENFAQSYIPTGDLDARMAFVISAAKKNIEEGTGGPFAAGVFETETGRLISLGVNLVTTQGMSMLHAEIVALAVAQRKLGSYDLGAEPIPPLELLTSTEPCGMCLGAIPWSGVRHVVTAAREEDANAIGFDEGPKPADWVASLNSRGIKVNTDIQRELASSVLKLYLEKDGHIYNTGER